jgi:hypothetical protein
MDWTSVLYGVLAVYGVWVLVCIGVYTRLDSTICSDSWHWEMCKFFYGYNFYPDTVSLYFITMVCLPLWILGLITLFSLGVIGFLIKAMLCLVEDWIIFPVLFGKRVLYWRSQNYWLGIIGDQRQGERWRHYVHRIKFLPIAPWEMMVIWGIVVGVSTYDSWASSLSFSTVNQHIVDASNWLHGLTTDPLWYVYCAIALAAGVGLIAYNGRIRAAWQRFAQKARRPLDVD